MLKSSSLCLYRPKIEQFWPFEEISIFSNSGHLEWRAGLLDTILKGTHPGTIPARFGLIWFIEQFWPFEEISIFSNSGHLEWRAGLLDTILKGTHPGTIPARFGLIWFRGEDLNVIFYQICLICIIGIYRLKEKFHRKTRNIC